MSNTLRQMVTQYFVYKFLESFYKPLHYTTGMHEESLRIELSRSPASSISRNVSHFQSKGTDGTLD